MLKPLKHVQDLRAENAELAARLKLADERTSRLQREIESLQGLKRENTRLSERVMLLEEEVRWFKEQFFGRSSQKSTSEMSGRAEDALQ
jgi:predicted nuclease with TOPRIM domain